MKSLVNGTESEKRRLKSGSWKTNTKTTTFTECPEVGKKVKKPEKEQLEEGGSVSLLVRARFSTVLQGFCLLRGTGHSLVIPSLSVSFASLTHPSFQLSFKQALAAPIKTQISGLHIFLPLIFHSPTSSTWRSPKPWSLRLSPLCHFSLTLSPLQAEHPLQMLWQSH